MSYSSYSHVKFSNILPIHEVLAWQSSGKLTVRPWQMRVGRLVKPQKMADFQGRTVNLPEGNHLLNRVEDQAIWLPGLTRSEKSATPTVDICKSIGQWEIFTGSCHVFFYHVFLITLWWTNKKQWKMAIEIVDFPINSMVMFHCYVSSPEDTSNCLGCSLMLPSPIHW